MSTFTSALSFQRLLGFQEFVQEFFNLNISVKTKGILPSFAFALYPRKKSTIMADTDYPRMKCPS
ncbi:hypothetical protein PHYBLDRAFT_158734 [Phycomyces blakesleeanus NRRL 1555(-)]|uniref:Uncharacterized protein n=1 Tax=Phycomyces blakesleeanus (strain ATCC 8743b / DSM 1359 / FGSC 10004 / NBRC 33097 / NRRL 1555) TaxID=763407 RepID=A0A163AHU3_PHYB8|nr:hypothetical protein PHYBLDRAFT_158734 [Phycomyces blakesleeanus NRRL 1555(-)]OAD73581.1 hypothetical protein PHYBLDRAFT_158734 [Phycomyces blakesleeanus NRRL 1555(-)]|eukprot:XP_018291621.1 hypothetical protein PHYBLDRAFT_158734 [Phycomyces blakesleeanus NRRL 1555(-)]